MCLGCEFNPLTGDIAQWLEYQNSNPKILASIPWDGGGGVKGERQFFLSLLVLVNSSADLFVPDPIRVYSMHPNLCAFQRSLFHLS